MKHDRRARPHSLRCAPCSKSELALPANRSTVIRRASRNVRSHSLEYRGAHPESKPPRTPRVCANVHSRIRDYLGEFALVAGQLARGLAGGQGDDWVDTGALTAAEKALIEDRFRDLEANPRTSFPWEEAKTGLLAPYRR